MAMVKTIKGIDENTWLEFKSMAAKNNMKMGALFEKMVDDYKKKSKSFWNEILNGPALLSDNEADAMMETVNRLRKEHGFRKIK